VLATFADGGIPDSAAPDHLVKVRPDQQGPIESFDIDTLPAGLLDAAIKATLAEPQIAGASLVVRAFGEGRLFVILTVVADDADRHALTDRLADQVVGLIGGTNYFAVEYVARDDPRLADPGRAAVLIPV
jgi:hypothetical protein